MSDCLAMVRSGVLAPSASISWPTSLESVHFTLAPGSSTTDSQPTVSVADFRLITEVTRVRVPKMRLHSKAEPYSSPQTVEQALIKVYQANYGKRPRRNEVTPQHRTQRRGGVAI